MKCSTLLLLLLVSSVECLPKMDDDLDDEDDIYSNSKQDKFKQKLQQKYKGISSQEPNNEAIYTKGQMPGSIVKLQKYFTIITDEIMADSLGIPQPINQVLFVAVVWFVTYVTTKISYIVLSVCYGPKQSSQQSNQKDSGSNVDEAMMSMLAEQVQSLTLKISQLKVSNQNQSQSNDSGKVGMLLQKIQSLQTQLDQRQTLSFTQKVTQEMEGMSEKINFIQAQIAEGEKNDLQLIKKIQNTNASQSVRLQESAATKPAPPSNNVTPRQPAQKQQQQSQRKSRNDSKSPYTGKRNNLSKSPIGRTQTNPKVPQLNLGGHQGQEAVPIQVQAINQANGTENNVTPRKEGDEGQEEEYYYDEEDEYGAEGEEAQIGGSNDV